MLSTETVIATTRSPFALGVALALPKLRLTAVNNPALTSEQWHGLYTAKRKPAVPLARALVSRRLTPEQLDHVLAVEQRPSILAVALKENAPTRSQLHALLDNPGVSPALLDAVLTKHPSVIDLDWLRRADRMNLGNSSIRLAHYLHAGDTVTDDEIADALLTYSAWGAEWDTERLQTLFATRPGVLRGAVRSDEPKVRTAAAGCRHLTDPDLQRQCAYLDTDEGRSPDLASIQWIEKREFVWVALVNNPACDLAVVEACDPLLKRSLDTSKANHAANRLRYHPHQLTGSFEDEADPTVIGWLIKRTMPTESKPRGRELDLHALLTNQHLSEGDVWAIMQKMRPFLYAELDPATREVLDSLMRRYPKVAVDCGFNAQEWLESFRPGESSYYTEPAPRDVTAEHLAEAASCKLGDWKLEGFPQRTVCYLELNLSENELAWRFLLSALDSQTFTGTLGELVVVANMTAL